jgi:hypothetical protein
VAERSFGLVPASLVLPVAGFAFSAHQFEIRTRDGAPGPESFTSQVTRDFSGRMRLEWQTHSDNEGHTLHLIELLDPVSGMDVYLQPKDRIATYSQRPRSGPGPFPILRPAPGVILPADQRTISTEPLGTRILYGIEVQGIRITQIPHGQPESIFREENWSSESYGLKMSIEISGPGWKHAAGLQNVIAGQPAPQLFSVPLGYTTRDP